MNAGNRSREDLIDATSEVDILLATFNGAKYLPALLSSLSEQTHSAWRLIVRDDGSTDGTLSIVENWAEGQNGRVHILRDDRIHLGVRKSFELYSNILMHPTSCFATRMMYGFPTKYLIFLSQLSNPKRKISQIYLFSSIVI